MLNGPNWRIIKMNIALFIYLASTYRIHFTEDTPAQDLLQSRHAYIIHNMQNDTQWTHRVHRTLEEHEQED